MLSHPDSLFQLPQLVLASASPRRAEILAAVGWPFVKDVPEIDESELPDESPDEYVVRLAKAKASVIGSKRPAELILGADTTVVVEGRIIGKPADAPEAAEMLRLLSGRWHSVLTGIAVARGDSLEVGVQSTRVKFSELSEAEIDFLIRYGEPLDKAGAYAVQAQAALFIESIEGDYWNVVGLPVNLLYETIRRIFNA
ncbi:MAG TPA: Maf family protein [Pyrinomonadaceae bacterium]|nr:Maf family protein [Pyrinomonadaceae bacterium]HMP65111.1 Maf family protein [Pyrinomonadaceae bacterium]